MTDVTKPVVELTPEQKAANEEMTKQIADRQQRMQAMSSNIAEGKLSIAFQAIGLAHLTINTFIPPQNTNMNEKSVKGKNAGRRTLTLADMDKVSLILERLTKAVANVESTHMNPMGMRGRM